MSSIVSSGKRSPLLTKSLRVTRNGSAAKAALAKAVLISALRLAREVRERSNGRREFVHRFVREPPVECIVQAPHRAVTFARCRFQREAIAHLDGAAAVRDNPGRLQRADDQRDRGAANAGELRKLGLSHWDHVPRGAIVRSVRRSMMTTPHPEFRGVFSEEPQTGA